MSSLLTAHCSHCSYHVEGIRFGSSMMNETLYIPGVRNDTREICAAAPGHDELISYYHNQEMYLHDTEDHGIESHGITIHRVGNKCPKCHQFALTFKVWGELD